MALSRALPAKLRFQVLSRDLFKCQYCGRGAPQVPLEVDHIVAYANGGASALDNLITSCQCCNAGKSNSEDKRVSAHISVMALLDYWFEAANYHEEFRAPSSGDVAMFKLLFDQFGGLVLSRAIDEVAPQCWTCGARVAIFPYLPLSCRQIELFDRSLGEVETNGCVTVQRYC